MPDTLPTTEQKTSSDAKPKQPWLWNVVLLDDDEHTYEYVIRMMQELFAHDIEKAINVAINVDTRGRAVCLTTHKEHAELKREQVIAFGRDPLMMESKGPMSCVLEPAVFEGDESNTTPPGDGSKA